MATCTHPALEMAGSSLHRKSPLLSIFQAVSNIKFGPGKSSDLFNERCEPPPREALSKTMLDVRGELGEARPLIQEYQTRSDR